MRLRGWLWMMLLASGCGCQPDLMGELDSGLLTDAGRDAGALDGGASDAGADGEPDSGSSTDAGPNPACLGLEVLDPAAVDAGKTFLFQGAIGGDLMPRMAWDNLYLVWGTGRPADLPKAMRDRYGFVESPTPNDGLPMGFRQSGTSVRADCLVCHAGRVNGQTMVGAANNQLDLALFVEDLKALAAIVGLQPAAPVVRTGARGVNDIIGMTLQLANAQTPSPVPINTEIGYQDPQAWWTLRTKTRVYTDGSGPGEGHRTFMATQLAFGATQASLEALEPSYRQLRTYLLSLTAPAWPFTAPAPDEVERGRAIYRQRCTTCHRDDRCERAESTIVARGEVGTCPVRSEKYGSNEVASLNASWFGATHQHASTGGYQAPSLSGVWASAPYFHNGSVPTLAQVLESSARPRFFRIIEGYDQAKVGVTVEVLTTAPIAPPRPQQAWVYDTTKPGLGNQGHTFGDALTATERADLLSFLKTL